MTAQVRKEPAKRIVWPKRMLELAQIWCLVHSQVLGDAPSSHVSNVASMVTNVLIQIKSRHNRGALWLLCIFYMLESRGRFCGKLDH